MLFTVVGPGLTSPFFQFSKCYFWHLPRGSEEPREHGICIKIPTSVKLSDPKEVVFYCFLGSLGNEREGLHKKPGS